MSHNSRRVVLRDRHKWTKNKVQFLLSEAEYLAEKRNGKSEILPQDIGMAGQLYCTSKASGRKQKEEKQNYKQKN